MNRSTSKTNNDVDRIRKEDIMRGTLMENCPLFPSSRTWVCHPSCNWWNGIGCTYPNLLDRKELEEQREC